MESLVSLAERDPVRHAYAYLTASRIYSAIGGENTRLATRYAALAVEEFAEYGHAFEARARNQLTRCHVKLQSLKEAEAERRRAVAAIARVRNADEKAFALADQSLSEARLEQARSQAAKTPAAALGHWKKAESAARAALEREPVPRRIRAEALVRTGQAVLKQRPKSAKAVQLVLDGIALAASLKRVRLVAAGQLVLAEHFHAARRPLEALMHLELAQAIEPASSSAQIDQWMNRLAGSIDQPIRVEVRGRQYKEVIADFQERLKDYYVGISRGDEATFREKSGLGRSEFFRAK
jgi:tetratricopeptide (TPR) repeat protein